MVARPSSRRLRIGEQLAEARHDIELRRIYADALIEEGGEHALRGELIHLEIAGVESVRRKELAENVQRARAARGLGGLHDLDNKVGLAIDWDCTADQLALFGAIAFAEEPLLRWITIEIGRREPQLEMRMLAAAPELARVRNLSIIANRAACPGPTGLATLLASPYLPRLESLCLANCRVGDRGAELLARATALSDVHFLSLWTNALGPDGVVAIACSPVFARVTHLILWGNGPGPRGIAALAAPENPMKLEALDIDESQLPKPMADALARRFPGIRIRYEPPS